MRYGRYKTQRRRNLLPKSLGVLLALTMLGGGYIAATRYNTPILNKLVTSELLFDDTIAEAEQEYVRSTLDTQQKSISGTVTAHTDIKTASPARGLFDIFVPVTNFHSGAQSITTETLSNTPIYVWHTVSAPARQSLADTLNTDQSTWQELSNLDALGKSDVALIPVSELTFSVKLLGLDDSYYLDDFSAGAFYRSISFTGGNADQLQDTIFHEPLTSESVFTANQTGVTALTRVMLRKLDEVGNPLYFSEKIGSFLADADLTHISNEVSFKEGCAYHPSAFCSDPRFIETLKDSGVDLVEIGGNHNNDVGSAYNTETINLYRELGWETIGGGLNTEDAAEYYISDAKNSTVAFLAYNYADSPNSPAIAGANTAGANSFDFDSIAIDIENAHAKADFVIVDVQYWECYSYPDEGYVEFPQCDAPIGQQGPDFKKLVDLGADMVVGVQAHQPQTYELYKGKPIYYGLGNLYFDQTSWPGTERGIVLTHYFSGGKLLQTKLTPTVYHTELQTKIMDEPNAVELLTRLQSAR